MPLPNLTAATAIELGPAPNTLTQNVRDAGTTYDVWYKYTALPGDNEIGIFAFGDLAVYKPTIEVFVGPLGSLVDYHFGFNAQNLPIQIPIEEAYPIYYFKIKTNSSAADPASLSITINQGAGNNPSAATLFITDDTNDLPAALVSISDGTPKAFIQGIATSENADILNNGSILLNNTGSLVVGDLVLYDFVLNKLVGITLSNPHLITANRTTNQFWVMQDGRGTSNGKLYNVSSLGVLSTLKATITTTFILDMAVSIDDKIMYYITGSPYAVKRWDLINNIALTDFLPARAGYAIPNRQSLLVLSDGTIIISYIKQSDSSVSILHYNAAGTLLNTYDFADTLDGTENTLICSNTDDPVSFLAWEHLSTKKSRFRLITVATGASTFVDGYQFTSGIYNYTPTATPGAFFGHSDSCAIQIMRSRVGGVYQIVPDKRNDTLYNVGDVKIPDPFFKTGLIGG